MNETNRLQSLRSGFSSVQMFREPPKGHKELMLKKLLSGDVSALKPENSELLETLSSTPWWLNIKWHSNCYYLYSEYYFEAWITTSPDSNGPRMPVEMIEITWRHGDAHGHEVRNNSDMVAKDDRVYSTGGPCDNICLHARATHLGSSAATTDPLGCAV